MSTFETLSNYGFLNLGEQYLYYYISKIIRNLEAEPPSTERDAEILFYYQYLVQSLRQDVVHFLLLADPDIFDLLEDGQGTVGMRNIDDAVIIPKIKAIFEYAQNHNIELTYPVGG